jgi:hypothetical protein
MFMNDELEVMGKELRVACLWYYLRICLEELSETEKNEKEKACLSEFNETCMKEASNSAARVKWGGYLAFGRSIHTEVCYRIVCTLFHIGSLRR